LFPGGFRKLPDFWADFQAFALAALFSGARQIPEPIDRIVTAA
jgi:hypothetical protein